MRSLRVCSAFLNSFTPYATRPTFYEATRMQRTYYSQAASPAAKPDMFCFQCEQTKDAKGCTTIGVCGKTPEVAALQDLLMDGLKAIGQYSHAAAQLGHRDPEIDGWVKAALFSTLTNVNFDENRFKEYLVEASQYKEKSKALYKKACGQTGKQAETFTYAENFRVSESEDVKSLVKRAATTGVLARRAVFGDDLSGLQELVTYGLKGMAAYADHALVYGLSDPTVDAFFHEVLSELANEPTVDNMLSYALKVGQHNVRVMQLLDEAHTTQFGHPEPTKVRLTPVAGKAILVSGHDLHDLELVLKQTEGKNINVYTHGEMLPAHGYPGLKKYSHLKGNYGGAWQEQKIDFTLFPGPILMTTNCIIEPKKSYKDRIFTRSVVGWPGVKHIPGDDMSALVNAALAAKGFEKDEPEKYTMTGFGRNAVLSNADKIVSAVQSGAIKHFFLIGGCDGAEGERSYFRDLALNVPKDAVVLTLACGKYRFNRFFDKFGDIGGIPRLLDVGQCNDAYSAIQIASALANAFKTDVNGLPLSFAISWFEQKAVAVLLSLLSLNIKNIHLGPNLPAFVTPNVLKVLVDKFEIKPTTNVETDMKHYMKQ